MKKQRICMTCAKGQWPGHSYMEKENQQIANLKELELAPDTKRVDCRNPSCMEQDEYGQRFFSTHDADFWCSEWQAAKPGRCGECRCYNPKFTAHPSLAEIEAFRKASSETVRRKPRIRDGGECVRKSARFDYHKPFPTVYKTQNGCGDFNPKEETNAQD